MGKKFVKHFKDDYDDWGDDRHENGYKDQLVERRRMKRMKNAMRSRRLDDILDLEEEY